MFDVTAVADDLDDEIKDADTLVRVKSSVGSVQQIAEADEINDETIAFARDGLERQEQIAQKQVDLLKEKNAAVVNLQQKIVAYNNVAEEINETATDYEAEASKFGIANGLDVDAITLANADDAGAFQVSVNLGDAGVAQLNVVNGKVVVTGLTAGGAAAVDTAQDALAEAQTALVDAQADADADAAQVWLDLLSDDNDEALDIDDADAAQALLDALNAALGDADAEDVGLDDLITALVAELAKEEPDTPDWTSVSEALMTAYGAKKLVVDELDAKSTAVSDAEVEVATQEGVVAAAKKTLADAKTEGASAKAVEEFNKLKGVDALKAQIEALHANIAKEEAAEKAIGVAALKALEEAGYKVFNDKEKVVAWSNVKVEEGKIVSAKDGKEFTVALEKDGKPDASINAEAVLFKTASFNEDGKLTAAEGLFAQLGDGQPPAIVDAAESSAKAVTALDDAQKAIKAFDEAVEAYNTAKELQADLKQATDDVTAADKAVIEAEEAFADLGAVLIVAEEGVAKGAVFDEDDEEQLADLFVFSETLTKVEAFDGDDEFYFGQDKGYSFKQVDAAKNIKVSADASVFEIFAVQEGANTVLYVEKEAFAGNSSVAPATNTDLVKVELVGVNAEDLQFNDGFLTFA